MEKLLCAPSELLVKIFEFLPASDLASLAKTCRRFRDVVAIDQIWHDLCQKNYKVSSLDGWPLTSYKELYAIVLHRYGCILGLWKLEVLYYGALIYVHVQNGKIIAENCCPPFDCSHLADPLRLKPLFEISIENKTVKTTCVTGLHTHHDGIVKVNSTKRCQAEGFTFLCSKADWHNIKPVQSQNIGYLQQWLVEEYNDGNIFSTSPHLIHLILSRYAAMHNIYSSNLRFNRLSIPSTVGHNDSIVLPGIYKGTYSSHGIELIMVCDCKDRILGTKITGDPNVPSGEITFDVDLTYPLEEGEEDNGSSVPSNNKKHPFHLPTGYFGEIPTHLKYYVRKFKGVGRIANTGFVSPQWTNNILYVFEKNEFGILWTELRAFAMFRRTEEEFLQN
ncbi:F-box only protein 31-like [Actinia tenebrosa]|uniref:F-box only protein 31-like n=1 Tax=Actinia tenebrosa TaxID=6105 RepID=A0A6P8IDG6_ACTTE|nr:F-box only protein 31-like [Actinia tenebrosa]